MAMRFGKCANFGLCHKADAGEVQAVPDGSRDFARIPQAVCSQAQNGAARGCTSHDECGNVPA